MAAVDAVYGMVSQMQNNGGLREVNRAFKKTARAQTPSLRYRDRLESFMFKLIEGLAAELT